MKLILSFVAALTFAPFFSYAETAQKAHLLDLTSGASISIPADWIVLQGERKVRVEEITTAAVNNAGVTQNQLASVQQLLNANNSRKEKYASITVTVERSPRVTRDMMSRTTPNEMTQAEKGFVILTNKMLGNLGATTRDWTSFSKVKIGTRDALMISYVRVKSGFEDTRATQYMFSGDGAVFTVTVSSVLSNESMMSNTLSEMVHSFAY
jgi:hypothetical protein